MKYAQGILSLVFLLCGLPPLAWAQTTSNCSTYEEPRINITAQFDQPQYDFSKNIPSILALENDHNHSIREGIPLGVTNYEKILSTNTRAKIIHEANNHGCMKIDQVDAVIGYKNVVVYIANEIPKQSCGFNEVMGHEQKHLNVNQKLLQEALPVIKQQILDQLRPLGVFHSLNINIPRTTMQETLTHIMKKFDDENTRRQQLVDSPEEYRRVSTSCNGQIEAISRRYRQTGQ